MLQTATIFAHALLGLPSAGPRQMCVWSEPLGVPSSDATAQPTAAPPSDTDDADPTAPAQDNEKAEAPEPYRTVVVEPAERDDGAAQRDLDRRTPGFATAIDLQETPGARPDDALAEVLARTPGASVRSVGGLGQFSAVSVRGSPPQQVQVFLDGVPVGGAMAGLVNLADYPLDGLTRLEIYRGHIPVAFGGATIGGAINLVTDAGHLRAHAGVHAGLGSFGARQTGAFVRTPVGRGRTSEERPHLSTRVSYAGAQGNFPFYDTGGTPLVAGDDTISTRLNNGYDRLLTQVRLDHRRGPWSFGVQELVVLKRRGEPGPATVQTREASLRQVMARTTAHVERDRLGRPGGRMTWVFGFGATGRHFDDPLGEVGVGLDDERAWLLDGYLSPRVRQPLWRGAFLTVVSDLRPEWIGLQERSPGPTPASGDATRARLGVGLGAELEQFLFGTRWLIVPALRVDGLLNRFAVQPGAGEPSDAGRDDLEIGFAPRIGSRLRILPWLQLRASAGRYFRPPTMIELFGDRGYFVGNEGLRPETGTAVDGGLVLDLQRPKLSIYGQLAGFSTWSDDLIQWIAAGTVSRPENLGAARVRGLESAFEIAPHSRALTLSTNYTLTDSENRSDDPSSRGRPLPGRPRHQFFGRATAGWPWLLRGVSWEPRILYTVEVIASNFLDPSGRVELPPRAIQGLGAELHVAGAVHLAVEVRNLLDVRTGTVVIPLQRPTPITMPVSDFLGYPLPGRSVWLTLRIDIPVHPPRGDA